MFAVCTCNLGLAKPRVDLSKSEDETRKGLLTIIAFFPLTTQCSVAKAAAAGGREGLEARTSFVCPLGR